MTKPCHWILQQSANLDRVRELNFNGHWVVKIKLPNTHWQLFSKELKTGACFQHRACSAYSCCLSFLVLQNFISPPSSVLLLLAMFSNKLSNIKLPLTAIIVHVAYLSKHWSFSPTLIMHSTYWPVMQPWSKLGTTFSNISTIGLHDRAFAPGNIKPSIQQYSNNSRQKGGDNDKLRRMRSHFKLLKYQVVRQNYLLGSDTYNPESSHLGTDVNFTCICLGHYNLLIPSEYHMLHLNATLWM